MSPGPDRARAGQHSWDLDVVQDKLLLRAWGYAPGYLDAGAVEESSSADDMRCTGTGLASAGRCGGAVMPGAPGDRIPP
jgi:hypothetical protein